LAHTHELARETPEPDEPDVIAEFVGFLQSASVRRNPTGPMPRFNQGRAAGCVTAEVIVPPDLPAELRIGLFAHPGTYQARVRFAHASSDTDTERDVRGMSIKVADAGGTNLTAGETSQDFILNSHPVMMVGKTKEFLALLQANEAGGARRVLFFLSHPHAAAVALASRKHHSSPLEISYWSTTPYAFGDGRAVKYIVTPVETHATPLPEPLTPDYLHERLRDTLAAHDAHFDLQVQFQTDAQAMPIEDASVEWRASESPYRTVARIRIPAQVVDRGNACERLTFNPWHAREEHRPLGSFNRARRIIYESMAHFRLARH
jgi:hypothetical protein